MLVTLVKIYKQLYTNSIRNTALACLLVFLVWLKNAICYIILNLIYYCLHVTDHNYILEITKTDMQEGRERNNDGLVRITIESDKASV